MIWLGLATIATVAIAWEDFRWRMVHLWWYVLLVFGLTGLAWADHGVTDLIGSMAVNLIFVLSLLFVLTIYCSLKERKWVYLFDAYIGWGDVLFFLVLTVYFDLESYILFTVVSLVLALACAPMFFRVQGKDRHIPLAGIQACCLLVYLWLLYFGWYSFPELLPR